MARAPGATLLHTPTGELSRAEVDRLSNGLANRLAEAGVGAGDTVLLLMGNSELYVFAWLGLAKLGAVEVPVNPQYRGQLLAHVINTSGARVLLADPELLENVTRIGDELGALKTLVVPVPTTTRLPRIGRGLTVVPLGDTAELDDSDPGGDPAYDEPMALMYTSGTTGPSKGVLVAHAHAYEYADSVRTALALSEDDVYYAPLPLFHIAGQWAVVYAALMSGGSAVIKRRFSVSDYWLDVARSGASASFLLGAMANFLFQQPLMASDRHNGLSRMLMSPLVPELDRFKERFGVEVATAYGSTEANVPLLSDFSIRDPRQCGRPRPGWQVEIVDGEDEVLAPGEAGEIVVRPPQPWLTMLGYIGDAEATAAAYRNCWLHTGDMAHRDAEGNFYFVDRIADAIRRRGENISSFEVEREVNAHPDVVESAAVGVASEHTEEELMVCAVFAADTDADPAQLHRFLRERAPRFMVPRYIQVVEALPKTETGKVRKAALRAAGTATAWDADATNAGASA